VFIRGGAEKWVCVVEGGLINELFSNGN